MAKYHSFSAHLMLTENTNSRIHSATKKVLFPIFVSPLGRTTTLCFSIRYVFFFTYYITIAIFYCVIFVHHFRIHAACVKCHWLALKYFQQSHISAACIAFAEMLGQDSAVMRVHLEAANEIYTHRCSCEAPTDIEQRKDAEKLIQQQTGTDDRGSVGVTIK